MQLQTTFGVKSVIYSKGIVNIFHKLCFFFCILKSGALQNKMEQVRGEKKECISYSLDFFVGGREQTIKTVLDVKCQSVFNGVFIKYR